MATQDGSGGDPSPPQPLAGTTVVDLTHVMAGAYCSLLLADMGADVLKVESVGFGDVTRLMSVEGIDTFGALNRNKRSLAVDLKHPDGAEAVARVACTADVLVENFKPGTLESFGLGYEALAARNPDLVYASISGFGHTGPARHQGGLDLVAQGMSGIMSCTGEPGRPPVKVGVPIADLNAGVFGALGVLSALAHRSNGGGGQHVDTSLLEAAMAYTVWETTMFFGNGEVAGPGGSAHRLAAPYESFPTADGWINVAAAKPAHFRRLCALLGVPDLAADPRFADHLPRLENRAELAELLAVPFRARTTEVWLEELREAGIPCGPVYTIAQAVEDEQVRAREMVTTDPSGARRLGMPVKLSASPWSLRRGAPELGEHTAEALTAAGYGPGDIDQLVAAGAVGVPEAAEAAQAPDTSPGSPADAPG